MTRSEARRRPVTAMTQVHRFYECVDGDDPAGAAALFTEDASYHRPGYPPFLGPEGVARFYSTERVIRSGRHELTTVLTVGADVAVCGEFHGVRHDGSPVDLRFADFFQLGPDNRFTRRDTFFFAPLA